MDAMNLTAGKAWRPNWNFKARYFMNRLDAYKIRLSHLVQVGILLSSIAILVLFAGTIITSLILNFSHNIHERNFALGLYGLFVQGLISSFIPVPTEFFITGALLVGINQVLVMVILDAGSVIGAIIAYYVGFKGVFVIGRISSRTVRIYAPFVKLKIFLNKYIWLVILISPWIPIIGDYSSIAAVLQQYKFGSYVLLTIAGKTIKIISIVLLINWILLIYKLGS